MIWYEMLSYGTWCGVWYGTHMVPKVDIFVWYMVWYGTTAVCIGMTMYDMVSYDMVHEAVGVLQFGICEAVYKY